MTFSFSFCILNRKRGYLAFLKLFFVDFSIKVVPTFPILPPTPPSTPQNQRQSPHHCSCPWVMHVSSLATPSTVLYFTSPWLFCNYLVVWPHVVGVSCMVQWHSLPYHPSWVLEVQPPCGLSTPSSCNWALVAIGRSMGGIYKGQVTASIGSDH